MIVEASEVKNALDKATIMAEHYKLNILNGNAFPRSVDDLFELCKEYIVQNIETNSLDNIEPDNSIRGTFLATQTGYEIYLSGESTKCKDRFVLCKELFHVLLDEEPYRNMDIYKHLKEVMLTFPAPDSKPSKAATLEQMAECAAMEFLFPFKQRQEQLIQYSNIAQPNHSEIAEYFKVPQYLVEQYLSENFMYSLKVATIVGVINGMSTEVA